MLTVGNIQSSSFRPLKVQVRIGLLRRSDSEPRQCESTAMERSLRGKCDSR